MPRKDAMKGNTKFIALIPNKSKYWCFTLFYTENNVLVKASMLHETLRRLCHVNKFVFGREMCPETKKEHWQGYIEFHIRKEFEWVVKNIGMGVHLEERKGTPLQNYYYCSKDNCEVNIFGDFEIPFVENPTIINDLKDWQKMLLNIMSVEPDDRSVLWIYDKDGKNGKTAFGKYCQQHKLANYLKGGKEGDMAYKLINKKVCRDVIIDYVKNKDNPNLVCYNFIENLKDGIIDSNKYESGWKFITTPHVVVFSNVLPNLSKMSADRWKLFTLSNSILSEYMQEEE